MIGKVALNTDNDINHYPNDSGVFLGDDDLPFPVRDYPAPPDEKYNGVTQDYPAPPDEEYNGITQDYPAPPDEEYNGITQDYQDPPGGEILIQTPPIFDKPEGLPVRIETDETKKNMVPYVLGAGVLFLLLASKKKKKVGKISSKDVLTVATAGGVVLGFVLLKKVFTKVGIFDSPETKNIDKEIINPESAFNPNFYKKYSFYTYAIDRSKANEYAKKIYDSFGFFNDCEECIFSVFYSLKTKSNVSFVSESFQNLYGQALLPFLRGGWYPQDRLSDSDVSKILDFVSKLPNN